MHKNGKKYTILRASAKNTPRFTSTGLPSTWMVSGSSLWDSSEIWQGFGDSPNCSIIHSTLDTCPRYEALSYTWGNASDLISCPINGKSHIMIITFAHCNVSRWKIIKIVILWVDQLCIKQRDLIEKKAPGRADDANLPEIVSDNHLDTVETRSNCSIWLEEFRAYWEIPKISRAQRQA